MILFQLLFFILGATAAEPKTVSIDNMSLEQKVGQLFIFGFPGHKVSKDLEKHLRALKPGSLIVFGRNIDSLKQTAALNNHLQKIALTSSRIPLFLAVDQEGGGVSRIKTSPPLPSAYTIGNTNEPTLAFQAGKVTGEMLKVLGFSMNLAPVLDITDDKLTSFVGARGFSESPQKVSSMGVAFAQGLSESNIIPVAKHFPGHGPIAFDSHQMTPIRQISHSDLFSTDLIPFTQFAHSNIDSGIMVAHISFPNIDKSEIPATYSEKIISNILKDQLKYKGLIMTDDIEMAGASTITRIEDRAVAAIKAGNDIVMVGWTPRQQRRAVHGVIEAVKNGTLTMERIDYSVKKILALKANVVAGPSRSLATSIGLIDAFKKIPYSSVFNEIISTYFKNLPGLQSLQNPIKKIRVISSHDKFIKSFRSWCKTPNLAAGSKLSPSANISDDTVVVYHVYNTKDYDELRNIPHALRKKMLVVSSHAKVHILDKDSFLDVVEVYSNHPNLGGYAAEAINQAKKRIAQN